MTTSRREIYEGRACGKSILVGEHAVLYGAQAVAIPLSDARMELTLAPIKEGARAGATGLQVKLGGTEVSQSVAEAARDAARVLGIESPEGVISGTSSLWMGAGLGSSAALSCALIRLFSAWRELTLSADRLAAMANVVEERFHGTPSGLDAAVVAWEKPIIYRRGSVPTVLETQKPHFKDHDGSMRRGRWSFALIDSGERASTKAMVAQSAPFFKDVARGEARVAEIDRQAARVIEALQVGDATSLAEAMTATHAVLSAAGLVTSKLADAVEAALDVGSLSAKVTGAGGGGAVLALLECDEKRADDQLIALRDRLGNERVMRVHLQ